MIFTCTINPSIDYVLHIDSFQYGGLNRGAKPAYYPGGKGINVSRILRKFTIDSTVLGFVGGFTGQFIKQALANEMIPTHFIETDEPTRINLKMKSAQETEINGPGPSLVQADIEQLLAQVKQLNQGDSIVLAGSLPPSVQDDLYVEIADLCHQNGARVIADTSSASLKALLGTPLFLVKPNQDELGELFNVNITSTDQAINYGKKLHQQGIEHVLISMGGAGAIYINHEQILMAKAPKGKVINTVGAGDSTVAGFLAAIEDGKSFEAAFRYAVASGSATAFSADLAEKEAVDLLFDLVEIEEV